MPLYILKNPDPQTLISRIEADERPAGYEESTAESADAWEAEQLAAGWAPAPVPVPVPLFVLRNPNPQTLLAKTYAQDCPAGYEPSTEADAEAWIAEQLAAGWTPAPVPVEPEPAPEPVRIDSDTVLTRMTAAERENLFTARRTLWQVDYFLTRASTTGIISTADPDLPAAKQLFAAYGIITADRWDGPSRTMTPDDRDALWFCALSCALCVAALIGMVCIAYGLLQ